MLEQVINRGCRIPGKMHRTARIWIAVPRRAAKSVSPAGQQQDSRAVRYPAFCLLPLLDRILGQQVVRIRLNLVPHVNDYCGNNEMRRIKLIDGGSVLDKVPWCVHVRSEMLGDVQRSERVALLIYVG